MKNLGLVAAVLMFSASASAYIDGGDPVDPSSDLAKNLVVIRKDGNMHCSGTLIAPKLVLTAAHCAVFDESTLEVGFGVDMGKIEKSHWRKITDKWIHPGYHAKLCDHDLAVLKLDDVAPVGFTPARIAAEHKNVNIWLRYPVTVAGYGLDSQNGSGKARTLNIIGEWNAIGTALLLPIQPGVRPGDSGGPLFGYNQANYQGSRLIFGVHCAMLNTYGFRHTSHSAVVTSPNWTWIDGILKQP